MVGSSPAPLTASAPFPDGAVTKGAAGRTSPVGLARDHAAAVALVFLLVFAAVKAPHFYNWFNLRSVSIQAAILGIVAVGQGLALLVRGLDLSVGAVAAVMATSLVRLGAGDGPGILAALAVGFGVAAFIGLLNGVLVTRYGVAPFVATLGMLIAVEGGRLALTDGQASGDVPALATYLGRGTVTAVPVAVVVWVLVLLFGAVLLHRSLLGRQLYATGSSPAAARLSGISTGRITVLAYVLCSMAAALAGLVLAGNVGYVDQSLGSGQNLNLNSIAAAVLGGFAFTGGEGHISGTVEGALLLIVVANLILVLGLPIQLQLVAQGAVLVCAVVLVARRS